MNYLDLLAFFVGTCAVLLVFTAKTNIEKSRVRVKVKIKK